MRVLRAKEASGLKLDQEEATVWRNRRPTEGDGLKPGDIVIVPNIPEQGRWVLARVAGPYRFEVPPPEAGVGTDFGHVVAVEPIRTADGKLAVIEADNEHVDARLRASMRSMSRMWSVDALGTKVDALIDAIGLGQDTARVQPETERFAGFSAAVATAAWEKIRDRYKGAEFETLVLRVFQHIYGATGRVQHKGGAGEKGADLLVSMRDPLGLEFKIAVQVTHQSNRWAIAAKRALWRAERLHPQPSRGPRTGFARFLPRAVDAAAVGPVGSPSRTPTCGRRPRAAVTFCVT